MRIIFITVAAILAPLAVAAADWAYKSTWGPHRVQSIETVVLRDAKRGKDIQIRVSWPETGGPFPVIVWSHGATGTKDMYQPLVRHWVGHGYVCMQPNHSESRALTGRPGSGAGTFEDWASRPGDIAFILDSLREIEARVPALSGKLQHNVTGVGGHSFGAHTAQLVAGATTVDASGTRASHSDPRARAFVLLSPQGIGTHAAGLDEHSWDGVTRPFIVITGTNDIGRNGDDWQWRLDPWKYAPRKDKFLLVIEGAWHGFGGVVGDASFRGAGPRNEAHSSHVKNATLAFWDSFLKKDARALAFLRSETTAEGTGGEARLSRGDGALPEQSSLAGINGDHAPIIEDANWRDTKRGRDVPVRIYAPKGTKGPLPVLVFSHGGGESRDAFTYLGEHLARRGYIAVFLTHKGSDREAFEKFGLRGMGRLDGTRPLDVRFVIDRVLSADPGSVLLKGRAGAVAVAGQCAGTTTAIALVGGTINLPGQPGASFTDPRVKACVLLGPQAAGAGGALHEASWSTVAVPALVVTGTRDFNWLAAVREDPALLRHPYDALPPGNHYLVEISGAEHNAFTDSVPYYPARERDPRHHGWICDAITAFLGAHLEGHQSARAWLVREELEKETEGACRQESKTRAAFNTREPGQPARKKAPEKETSGQNRQAADSVGVRVHRMFQFLDRDDDGALSRAEMPERLKRGFDKIDRDRDGEVSRDEMIVAVGNYERRMGGGREAPRREREEPVRREQAPAQAPGLGCAPLVSLRDAGRGKNIQVRVTWPEKPGLFPVIVFSHRVGGSRHDYRPLVEHWARGGFVVVQADHSDSRELARSGTMLDWADRARDMSFVIDSLAEIQEKVPEMKGRMDLHRVGAGGHLIGAYAACVLAGQKNFSVTAPRNLGDDRVRAVLLLSPPGRGQGLNEKSWQSVTVPLMVLSGSRIPSLRTGNPAEWRRDPFTFSPPGDKYLVWIEGLAGSYAGLIEPGQGDDEKAATWILDTTMAFWNAHLEGDPAVRARLRALPVTDGDRARLRIESKPGVPLPVPAAAQGLPASNPEALERSLRTK